MLLDAGEMLVEIFPDRLALHLLENFFHDVDPELGNRHQRLDTNSKLLELLYLVLQHLVLVRFPREVRDGETLGFGDEKFEKRGDVGIGTDVEKVFVLSQVHDVHTLVHLSHDVAVRDPDNFR